MKFEVVFEGFVVQDPDDERPPEPEGLQRFLDRVMEELHVLDAQDPAIGANGASGSVEISITVPALRPEEAVSVGSSLIRTAIHVAGGFTPGWRIDWCEARASRAELVDA